MKINRDNYEAYFLDYHEGQLSSDLEKEVLLFVELNPDLRELFSSFEAVTLVADEGIVYDKKSFLKKNVTLATSQVNELNYEEFLVNEIEGLLAADQQASLNEFIHINPQYEKERRLYALAHLEPANDVIFEAKDSLKQKVIGVGPIDSDSFETYMARELEGDLNQAEKLQLAEFMQYNPHLERDRKLYQHTILNADTSIIFEDKKQLKHSVTPAFRIVYYALSAAASLAVIMSLYFLLERHNLPGNIAQQGKVKSHIDNQIKEPVIVVPDKQVAINNNKTGKFIARVPKAEVSPKSPSDEKSSSNIVIPEEESVALVDRHEIDILSAYSAKEITSRQYVDPQFIFIRTSQMYMNDRLEFYYNLKLAEEIQYAEVNAKDKNPAKTIFKAITGRGDESLASKNNEPAKEEKKNLSLWTFAELGVKTFNKVTSSDLELNLSKDEEGKVVSYGLEGGMIDFQKDLKK